MLYKFFHVGVAWLSRPVWFLNDYQSRGEVEDNIPPRRGGRPHYPTPRCMLARLDLSAAVSNEAPEEFASQPSVLGNGRL